MANVVAIKHRGGPARLEELFVQFAHDGAFSAPAQPGEPDHHASLTEPSFTLVSGNGMVVPDDVGLSHQRVGDEGNEEGEIESEGDQSGGEISLSRIITHEHGKRNGSRWKSVFIRVGLRGACWGGRLETR